MSTVAMTGSDTNKINGRILNDLADGDCAVITYPNEMASVKVGKGGNSIYALNKQGDVADLVMRIVRGSDDDKFLNNLMSAQNANFASFVLMNGEFIKNVGDGKGNVSGDTYILSGGIFTKPVEVKSNQEGDVAQSVSEYHVRFSKSPRIIA